MRPYYDEDESNHEEIEAETPEAGAEPEQAGDEGAPEPEPIQENEEVPSIIDLVADQKAADVKQHVFQALYGKVGEKLDAMKADVKKQAFGQSE